MEKRKEEWEKTYQLTESNTQSFTEMKRFSEKLCLAFKTILKIIHNVIATMRYVKHDSYFLKFFSTLEKYEKRKKRSKSSIYPKSIFRLKKLEQNSTCIANVNFSDRPELHY